MTISILSSFGAEGCGLAAGLLGLLLSELLLVAELFELEDCELEL